MIDFSTLQALTVPEGVVAKIESGGVILWELQTSRPILLEVEKITSDTYAAETTYSGESFILLDVYPRSGGTVTVTYGGLTKTITDDGTSGEPNAQPVFFGTFNGVSDETETPDSGTLTIEGGCSAFGVGSYAKSKSGTVYCDCITEIESFGSVSSIPDSAFHECSLTLTEIPVGIKHIGNYAFMKCTNVAVTVIPEGVETIGISSFKFVNSPFDGEIDLYLPSTLKSIGSGAFTYSNDSTSMASYTYCKNVYIAATEPPVLGGSTPFGSQTPGDPYYFFYVYVPKGCAEVYKADEKWSSMTIREEIEVTD